jgi:hypothetical protein
LTIADVGGAGVSRIVISTHCIATDDTLCALAASCVNTSLSGTLFF